MRHARPFALVSLVALSLSSPALVAQNHGPRPTPHPPITPGPSVTTPPAQRACPTGDCVAHDLSTQDECATFERAPTGDARWAAGLSRSADRVLFQERGSTGWTIAAYRIQWSNGAWSEWLVPGVNDLDHKFNTNRNTMRRMWSYFADHAHQAIACRPRQ